LDGPQEGSEVTSVQSWNISVRQHSTVIHVTCFIPSSFMYLFLILFRLLTFSVSFRLFLLLSLFVLFLIFTCVLFGSDNDTQRFHQFWMK
jgi:hypothetical protein